MGKLSFKLFQSGVILLQALKPKRRYLQDEIEQDKGLSLPCQGCLSLAKLSQIWPLAGGHVERTPHWLTAFKRPDRKMCQLWMKKGRTKL